MQATWDIVRRYPSTLLVPLLLLGLLLGLGLWAVEELAKREEQCAKDAALARAEHAAHGLSAWLALAGRSLQALAASVHATPDYATYNATLFSKVAPDLFAMAPADSLLTLELAPNGIVSNIYPPGAHADALGLDLLQSYPSSAGVVSNRQSALTVLALRNTTWTGPFHLKAGGMGGLMAVPIFVDGPGFEGAQGPFNGPVGPTNCSACTYNATTNTRFWGFGMLLVDTSALSSGKDARLAALVSRGYAYRLYAPSVDVVMGQHGLLHPHALSVQVQVPNAELVLSVSRAQDGWGPDWHGGMVAVVVVVSLVISLLQFLLLLSRRHHHVLLEDQLPQDLLHSLKLDNVSITGTVAAGGRQTKSVAAPGQGGGTLAAETPADKLLGLLTCLLRGEQPSLPDIIMLRTTLMRGANIYQPINLARQIRANLDADVAGMLLSQLHVGMASQDFGHVHEGDEQVLVADGGMYDTFSNLPSFTNGNLRDSLALIIGGTLPTSPQLMPTARESMYTAAGQGACQSSAGTQHSQRQHSAGASCVPTESALQSFFRRSGNLFGNSHSSSQQSAALKSGLGLTSRHRSFPSAVSVGAAGGRCMGCEPGRTTHAHHALDPIWSTADISHMPSLQLTCPSSIAVQQATPFMHPQAHVNVSSPGPHSCAARASAALPLSVEALQLATAGERCNSTAGAPGSGSASGDSVGPWGSGWWVKYATQGPSAGLGGVLLAGGSAPSSAALVADGLSLSAPPACEQCTLPSGSMLSRHAPGAQQQAHRTAGLHSAAANACGSPLRVTASAQIIGPSAPLLDAVEVLLGAADAWHFNVHALQEASQGHALSVLGYFYVHRAGLISRFNIPPVHLARYLRHVEAGYLPNPYHNAVHAACVLHMLHTVLLRGGLTGAGSYAEPLGLMASYLAAIVHDYQHLGVTNDFLINTQHPLAVAYNDRSPMESHHLAAAFMAAREPGMSWLSGLNKQEATLLRKQVIDMVLATDMKQHFSLISHFNAAHSLSAPHTAPGDGPLAAPAPAASATPAPVPMAVAISSPSSPTSDRPRRPSVCAFGEHGGGMLNLRASMDRVSRAYARMSFNPQASGPHSFITSLEQPACSVSATAAAAVSIWGNASAAASSEGPGTGGRGAGSGRGAASCPSERTPACLPTSGSARPLDEGERLLVLQVALKVADLGHLTLPLDVHLAWVSRLQEEFFAQGDREGAAGLTISPLFDRHKKGVAQGQVPFYDFVALPLFRSFVGAFPALQPVLDNLNVTYAYWRAKEVPAAAVAAAPGPATDGTAASSTMGGNNEPPQATA